MHFPKIEKLTLVKWQFRNVDDAFSPRKQYYIWIDTRCEFQVKGNSSILLFIYQSYNKVIKRTKLSAVSDNSITRYTEILLKLL